MILILVSLGLLATRGLNYALDFTGGVLVEARYEQPVEIDQVRAALETGGFHGAQVQSVGGTRDVSIRLQPREDQKDAAKVGRDVVAALEVQRKDVSLKRPPDLVGPQVGAELRADGFVAAVFVMIGIMIYIGIRFEKRFAFAAIASEVHDAILTLGFFAATQIDFDLTVLASLLAVLGYSINDKVVVFDRVREIFRSSRKGEPYEILNRSINSTMSRTIMTGLTTSLAVGTLYFVGGPALENFGLIMLIGILVGTLSSVFFANPILLWLGVSKQDLMPKTKEDPELAARP